VPISKVSYGETETISTAVGVIGSSMGELSIAPLSDFEVIAKEMKRRNYTCQFYSGYLFGCDVGKDSLSDLPDMHFAFTNSNYELIVKAKNYAWKVCY